MHLDLQLQLRQLRQLRVRAAALVVVVLLLLRPPTQHPERFASSRRSSLQQPVMLRAITQHRPRASPSSASWTARRLGVLVMALRLPKSLQVLVM